MDVNGRRLAFTWQYSVEGSEGGPNTEVRVHTLGGRRILVDRESNFDSDLPQTPCPVVQLDAIEYRPRSRPGP